MNPVMGCGGCELFPSPGKVLAAIDNAITSVGVRINSRTLYKELINEAYRKIKNPKPGHKNAVNTTNIWHLRDIFLERVKHDHGEDAADAAEKAIRQSITCYAGTLHMNKGLNLLNPDYEGHVGYAPIFEAVKRFEGRAMDAAKLPDLPGCANPKSAWKARLPRLIFVSDMGDALTTKADFPFLNSDLMPAIQSPEGKHHLWLWLTKRPERMAEFAEEIGGLPKNVCAMTTLTGPDEDNLKRLADLKKVKAHIRGLSIEPLWERIPPSKLNLKGIDWVIVGGESGSGFKFTRPFALEWVEELREHCRKHGVAFFLKQLGRNPTINGRVMRLKNGHGGEWEEWDEALRIREFPKAFHNYRKAEMIVSDKLRPIKEPKKKKADVDPTITPEEKSEFRRLDKIVRNGVLAFMECGKALIEIQEKKLWRVGGWPTWEDYCRQVVGLSKPYANRIINATRVASDLFERLPIGNSVTPVSESQVRPLLKLESEQRVRAWDAAVEKAKGGQPTAVVVEEIVFEILNPDGPSERSPSRSQRRSELVGRLKEVVAKRKSWEQVEELMAELEELL
ncbi:MAG: DUF5131 family protein [Akkermansiaceae bacterium]